MLYTRGLYDSIHLNLYPIINGGGGLCHVKFDHVIDFSLSEIKNKTIISDDSRLEVVMISEIKPNMG